MARSIVGLFPDRAAAERAVVDLKEAGFDPRTIGLVMRDRSEARAVAADQGVNSTAGAVTGGVIGGTAGAILVATGALAVPGVGPFITGGVLASLVGGTAGWLIGGLVGMGVPREEAEYYQGRVEQGGVLVTVEAHGRDAEARQIMLRDGAEDERTRGGAAPVASRPAAANQPGTQPLMGASEPDRTASGKAAAMDTQRDEQRYPPAESGIAPGTVAGTGEAADTAASVGGVQPSAVSSRADQAPTGEPSDAQDVRRDTQPTPYSDTVTSSGAQEGADYSRRPARPPDRHPVTDEDIIADARGARRETDPDLDVDEQQPDDQRGLV